MGNFIPFVLICNAYISTSQHKKKIEKKKKLKKQNPHKNSKTKIILHSFSFSIFFFAHLPSIIRKIEKERYKGDCIFVQTESRTKFIRKAPFYTRSNSLKATSLKVKKKRLG